MDLDFEAMDDNDALKITLFYFVNRILNRRKKHCRINFKLLNEVNEINHFWNCLWGHLSWETIYKSLDNALNSKPKEFKKACVEKPKYKIENYNVYNFTSVVQVCDDFFFII